MYANCCSTSKILLKIFVFAQANPELAAIWAVGQCIWQRDFPGIYSAIAAHQWSEPILPVMESLRGTHVHLMIVRILISNIEYL